MRTAIPTSGEGSYHPACSSRRHPRRTSDRARHPCPPGHQTLSVGKTCRCSMVSRADQWDGLLLRAQTSVFLNITWRVCLRGLAQKVQSQGLCRRALFQEWENSAQGRPMHSIQRRGRFRQTQVVPLHGRMPAFVQFHTTARFMVVPNLCGRSHHRLATLCGLLRTRSPGTRRRKRRCRPFRRLSLLRSSSARDNLCIAQRRQLLGRRLLVFARPDHGTRAPPCT